MQVLSFRMHFCNWKSAGLEGIYIFIAFFFFKESRGFYWIGEKKKFTNLFVSIKQKDLFTQHPPLPCNKVQAQIYVRKCYSTILQPEMWLSASHLGRFLSASWHAGSQASLGKTLLSEDSKGNCSVAMNGVRQLALKEQAINSPFSRIVNNLF